MWRVTNLVAAVVFVVVFLFLGLKHEKDLERGVRQEEEEERKRREQLQTE